MFIHRTLSICKILDEYKFTLQRKNDDLGFRVATVRDGWRRVDTI